MGGQSSAWVGDKALRKRGTQFRVQKEVSEGLTRLIHLGGQWVTLLPRIVQFPFSQRI